MHSRARTCPGQRRTSGKYLGDATVTAAILDRLAMTSVRLDIDGPSYRQHVGQERARKHGATVPDDTTDP